MMAWWKSRGWRGVAFEVAMAAMAVAALVPIWRPEWLPLQDLPQHLAAIRVIGDFAHPELRFEEFFRLTPLQTQYLGYYGAVWILSWVFEVGVANRLFLSMCLVGTPYAMRYLLAELGRPRYLVWFVFPLLYNTFLLLGFVNFIAAVPLMLFGLGLAVRLRDEFTTGAAVGLGVVGLICFFMHVVPFAFLAIGTAAVGLGGSVRATLRRWLPMLPAGIVSIAWTFFSPAGTSATEAVGRGGEYRGWATALEELPDWLINLTPQSLDERLLVVYAVVVVIAIVAGAWGGRGSGEGRGLSVPLAQRIGFLAPLAFVGYFVLPISYDWIWPISPRFGLLGLVLLIPALPAARRVPAHVISLLLVGVTVVQFSHVGEQFRAFSQREVGNLEEAIEAIPPGRRVAGLIFDRGSQHVRFSPFLHAVAYYQARRGGAVMFTFADFPQSPYRFREENRPPRVRPRWEWTPHRVDPREDLGWYEYVLVRGGPGEIRGQGETFEKVFHSRRWSVWKRTDG